MNRLSAGLLGLLVLTSAARAGEAPDTSVVVQGNTRFALSLYGQLKGKEGNLFFSPFSISTALSMTSAGAGGRTLEQMTAALQFPKQAELHPACGSLLKQMNDPARKGYQLSVANALWGQKGYPFHKKFLDLNKELYGAGLEDLDFTDPESARKVINAWVEKETKDKIKDLLKKDTLAKDTRLVLTNAIYFKGEWASQFKADKTREGTFYSPGKAIEDVPFMVQTGKFNAAVDEKNVLVLEMPFAGNELSMVLLVPTKKDGLADLEKELTPKALRGWLEKMKPETVAVHVPRFSLSAEFDLKQALAELGMPIAFDPAKADFSGLNEGKEGLYLSAVVHKAYVDVNEKGAEASAATAVGVHPRSDPPLVRADRPFLFLIRDKKTDSLLFMGRLVQPTEVKK